MREYVATFDAGTTAIKGALVDDAGHIVVSASGDLDLIVDDAREQDPNQWWRVLCDISQTMLRDADVREPDFAADRICGIICSGQM